MPVTKGPIEKPHNVNKWFSDDTLKGGENEMAEIKILDNGPLVATGVTLIDSEGNKIETKDQVYLCRCGLSGKKPFCDGSHKNKFESTIRA
jgi:hypothetical protein